MRGYTAQIDPDDARVWELVNLSKYLGVAPWDLEEHSEYLPWVAELAQLEEKIQDHESRKAGK